MKAVGSGTSVLTAVDGKRVASSPIVVGGGEAIVGIKWTMAGRRKLVRG
jgi:hypothetical protein